MDPKELNGLMEAYMDVYQEETTTEPDPFGRPGGKYGGVPKKGSSYDRSIQANKKAIEDLDRKKANEEVDLYDIILSHLLDEGYADTQEQAEVIMVNMSEDWREGIVEASAAAQRGLPEPHRLMKSANARVAGEKRKTHLGRISLEKKASSHRERQTPEAQAATKDSAARLERINRINARPRTTKEKGLFGAITKSGRLGS